MSSSLSAARRRKRSSSDNRVTSGAARKAARLRVLLQGEAAGYIGEKGDYDSDAMPLDSDDDPEDCLKWRGNPEDTYSDWKIELISHQEEEGTKPVVVGTYHVHKFILACGSRKSEYFASLFQNVHRYSEFNTNTSRIELSERAAKAFPSFLDYIYQTGGLRAITSKTVIALYYLGQYFSVKRLCWQAKMYLNDNIGDAGAYYEQAKYFQDEKIVDLVTNAFASNIQSVDTTSRIVELSDVSFWVNVMEKVKKINPITQCKWQQCSKLIAVFCQKSLDGLDLESFQKLTSEDILPCISSEAALQLMETERQLVDKSNQSSSSYSSSLRDRCVQALSGEWKQLAGKETPFMERLKKQHPEFLAELLSTCLAKASSEVASASSSEPISSPSRLFGQRLERHRQRLERQRQRAEMFANRGRVELERLLAGRGHVNAHPMRRALQPAAQQDQQQEGQNA